MADPDDHTSLLKAEASTDESGAPLIRVTGELDLASAPQLTAVAKSVLESGPASVVFDLAAVEFMDSSGVRVLLEVATEVDTVVVRNASVAARRVLESAGVDQVLTLES